MSVVAPDLRPRMGTVWVLDPEPIKDTLRKGISEDAASNWEAFYDGFDPLWVIMNCWRLVPYVIEETP